MNDKTFEQALSELNQRALKEITREALQCWTKLQQGMTVAHATAHLENTQMRDAVTHVLFYVLLQSLLFNAKQHTLIDSKRYEELRAYVDKLSDLAKQPPIAVLPCTV